MVLRLLVQTGTTETEIGIGTETGIGTEIEIGTEIMTVTETVVVVIQIGTGATETAQDRPGGILIATIEATETGRATGVAAIGDVRGPQGAKRGEKTRRRETEMWRWRTERGGEVLRHPHHLALSRGSRSDVIMDGEREIEGLGGTMRMAIPGRTGISLQGRSPKRQIKNCCFSLLLTNTIDPRRYDTPYYTLS